MSQAHSVQILQSYKPESKLVQNCRRRPDGDPKIHWPIQETLQN
jgi:hypothetical protein